MNAMPTNMSLYCTASKEPFYNSVYIMNIDPSDIMFVEFFGEKYLSAQNKLPACIGCR